MPPKAPPSAAVSVALQPAAAAAGRFSAGAMGAAGSRDALGRLNAAMGELKALAVQPMLQQAVNAMQQEDFKTGETWAIKALEKDERNGFGWYLLGIARERAGDFASSVKAYESALALLPDHAEIANDLGRLAFRMGMSVQAGKLFQHFLARYPGHPEGTNNLACALRDQGRQDEAVEVLKPAINEHPHVPILWNTLGTALGELGDYGNAQVFFEEALRLDAAFGKARYNLGNARLALGDPSGALEACDAGMALTTAEDERQMMRLARSTILMALGRIGEGWDDYEARRHPQFAGGTYYLVNRPPWQPGADLAGKTLLVVGEQGLGDEILFANALPDVLEKLGPDGRMRLAVEPRLVSLFARSYPDVEVSAHETRVLNARPARLVPGVKDLDKVDLWVPIGSLLREFRRTVDAFPDRVTQLQADPARVGYWREQVEAAGPGKKVGLLWKSAISKNARHRYFSPFAQWSPVLATPGVTFVNLQYGDCAEELALARKNLGVEIWQPPGIDLKQDLDEVAALCCALDLVAGFSNATLNIAAACGAPSWLISTPGAWTRLGTEDRYPWYPQVKLFAPKTFGDWDAVMGEMAEAMAAWAG